MRRWRRAVVPCPPEKRKAKRKASAAKRAAKKKAAAAKKAEKAKAKKAKKAAKKAAKAAKKARGERPSDACLWRVAVASKPVPGAPELVAARVHGRPSPKKPKKKARSAKFVGNYKVTRAPPQPSPCHPCDNPRLSGSSVAVRV